MSENSQLPEQSPTEAQPPLDVPEGSGEPVTRLPRHWRSLADMIERMNREGDESDPLTGGLVAYSRQQVSTLRRCADELDGAILAVLRTSSPNGRDEARRTEHQ